MTFVVACDGWLLTVGVVVAAACAYADAVTDDADVVVVVAVGVEVLDLAMLGYADGRNAASY